MHYKDIIKLTKSSPYQVDVSWDYLQEWLARQERDCVGFETDPDFQRCHVWDDEKRTKYVEYMLRGGNSSYDIYFNCSNYTGYTNGDGTEGPMQLVDGKQRLTAVLHWLEGKIPAFGVFRKDMIGSMRIVGPRFRIHVNDLGTRAEVLRWYLEMNAGGVAHTAQELDVVRALLATENK